jgi:hypothetical protein
MKNDALKKHHFWILLGLIPLLVLISVVMITSGVGAAIAERQSAIEAAKGELAKSSSPKPGGILTNLDIQIVNLKGKRTDLWKENWERSIGVSVKEDEGKEDLLVQDQSRNLLRWPNSPLLNRFNYTKNYETDPNQLKFGVEIVRQEADRGEYNEFKKQEVYLYEFSNPFKTGMADKVAPTTFRGGRWQSVLRHVMMPGNGVTGWGQGRPTYKQLWLALEDIWVQRAMLGQITAVNKQMAEFKAIPRVDDKGQKLPDSKLERDFQSRIWRVSLKVAPRETDGKYVVSGTLTNVTDRLQLMGVGNMMTLNVWFSNDPNAQPMALRIGGEFVPGRGSGRETIPIVSPNPVLPPGIAPTEIARIEQVFDSRTVPVRRIDHLALGQVDSRHAQVELKMPKFFEGDATAAVPTDPMSSELPGGIPGGPGGGLPGGPGGTQATTILEGGGPAEAVLNGNKRRYLVVTDQVRRMPVAITVIVDQSYIQDVLLAYSNCPLRFQITQVHWQRYRGGATGAGSGTGMPGYDGSMEPGMTPDQPVYSGQGYEGSGFGVGSPDGGMGGGGIGLRPFGFGLPGAGGLPGAAAGPGPGFPGAMPPGSPGMPPGMMPPGMMPPGMPGSPYGPGGTMTTVTDSQLTSGLVEMTVYGLVSLYEKYDPATAGVPETAAAPAPPAEAPPAEDTAAP